MKAIIDRKNAIKSQLKELQQPKMGKHSFNLDKIRELQEEYSTLSMLENGFLITTEYLNREEVIKRFEGLLTAEEINNLLDNENN